MSIQYPRLKAAIFVLLCAAPLTGSVLVWLRGETIIPLAAYGVVSLIAFFLYWSDKRKAQTDRWRTRKTSCTPWSWPAVGRGR